MRQRRWMEFLKDYDFELLYHSGKANVVADALSRKTVHTAHLMIKEVELLEEERQLLDASLDRVREQLGSEEARDFALSDDGILRFRGRVCIPDDAEGMKKDVAQFVSACLTCQKAKVEHQRPGGILQPLEILLRKYVFDLAHVLEAEDIQIREDLTVEVLPIALEDSKENSGEACYSRPSEPVSPR
ncbi:uncharacterized protein LOC114191247 [Vigna unguiculata]|uniref:uncharacterized protein LOC114191247 n=1 Tax=Vigna unguiculata TaxID=3917 RepID=UPI0010161628|nr:uncharacterized protein LOC114191247 [Vigna unguiculata]